VEVSKMVKYRRTAAALLIIGITLLLKGTFAPGSWFHPFVYFAAGIPALAGGYTWLLLTKEG
jgi:hypothetical protein